MTAKFSHNIMLTGPFLARNDSKLNLGLNESPYQLPDSIKRAVSASLERLHRYPLGHEDRVIELIARHYNVTAANVAITHGVDEALDRVIELYPQMRYVLFCPTFIGYEARLRLAGVEYVVFTYGDDFEIREEDLERLRANDLVVLASPNNPTGVMLEEAVLRRLRDRCGKVFLDEAYIDFAGTSSALRVVDPDLFVFRSLSKVFAMAGQRLGFLFGAEPSIAEIRNRQWFCNINLISLDLIANILGSPFMAEYAARTVAERERVIAALRAYGFAVTDSHANFILLRSPRARAIIDFLDRNGIVVMDTSVFGLANHVRITIGTSVQNDQLLAAMRNAQASL